MELLAGVAEVDSTPSERIAQVGGGRLMWWGPILLPLFLGLAPVSCGGGSSQDDTDDPASPSLRVLYLNFGGVELSRAEADDATSDLTAIDALARTHLPHSGSFGCETVAEVVAEHFAPFELDIVCERPDAGAYTMVVVSSPGELPGGQELQRQGPPPDCGNTNESNVGLVEVAAGASVDVEAVAVAVAVSHVAGITYGLDEGHDFPLDLASFDASADATWFDMCFPIFDELSCPEQNLANCGAEDLQNSYLELAAVLGER